jgi:hypothetical protein
MSFDRVERITLRYYGGEEVIAPTPLQSTILNRLAPNLSMHESVRLIGECRDTRLHSTYYVVTAARFAALCKTMLLMAQLLDIVTEGDDIRLLGRMIVICEGRGENVGITFEDESE